MKDVAELRQRVEEAQRQLGVSHAVYDAAVNNAIDEPDPVRKVALHKAAQDARKALFVAAEESKKAYEELMDSLLQR